MELRKYREPEYGLPGFKFKELFNNPWCTSSFRRKHIQSMCPERLPRQICTETWAMKVENLEKEMSM